MAEKKTLYHSELVQMGRVQVTQKDLPKKSKFAGKSPYVVLDIDGEERIYNCENDACFAFFNVQGNQGRCMVIEAQGTRENAQIDWINDIETPLANPQKAAPPARQAAPAARQAQAPAPARAAAPAPRPAPAAQPHGSYAPPTNTPPPPPPAPAAAKPPTRKGPTKEEQQATLKKAKLTAAKLANLCQIGRTAAEHSAAMFKAQRGTDICEAQIQAWTATINIELMKSVPWYDLPAGVIAIGTPAAPIPGDPDPGEQGVEGEDDVPM